MENLVIAVLIGTVVVAAICGYLYGRKVQMDAHDEEEEQILHRMASQVTAIQNMLSSMVNVQPVKKDIVKEVPKPKVKVPIEIVNPEELDKSLSDMLLKVYPKEMVNEYLALSDEDKQIVINELKNLNSGKQSISNQNG